MTKDLLLFWSQRCKQTLYSVLCWVLVCVHLTTIKCGVRSVFFLLHFSVFLINCNFEVVFIIKIIWNTAKYLFFEWRSIAAITVATSCTLYAFIRNLCKLSVKVNDSLICLRLGLRIRWVCIWYNSLKTSKIFNWLRNLFLHWSWLLKWNHPNTLIVESWDRLHIFIFILYLFWSVSFKLRINFVIDLPKSLIWKGRSKIILTTVTSICKESHRIELICK